MTWLLLKCILLVSVIKIIAVEEEELCPSKCICKRNTAKDEANYIKMTCGAGAGQAIPKILHLDELELNNVASEIIQLNLSNNLLTSFSPKVELIALQKLDISRNDLTELRANQFDEVPNLRRLDISGNNIKQIDLLAFTNLKHLERLKLNDNQITSISLGTFDPFISLKQLDISNNPLVCDCGLLWLLDWCQKKVKLISNPKCSSPTGFKGTALRKVKIGDDIHCKSPAASNGLPIIDLRPHENQVVFEGDALILKCRAPSLGDSYDTSNKIQWTWLDSDPKYNFTDINIENENLTGIGHLGSTLSISKLKRNHTGIWSCLLLSNQGNHSKGITVVVISNETRYCPMTVTSNNKGTYNWPRTIVNYTVSMPCESVNPNFDVLQQKANYLCSVEGEWYGLNTTMCSYLSDTTKILEQFSKQNTNILESVIHLHNYTSNLMIFKDVMDLDFTVKTLANYVKFTPVEDAEHVSEVLIEITNNLMKLPKAYLRQADMEAGSCRKLLNVTETLAAVPHSPSLQRPNIALETFSIKTEAFNGITCSWFVNPSNRFDTLLSCVTNDQAESNPLRGKITEASITIPESLFIQLTHQQDMVFDDDKNYNLLISMHSNSSLFPIDEVRNGKEEVTSAVVGVKLVDFVIRNLTDPIYIMLRTPPTTAYEVTPFVPVWWDPDLNNGSGSWSDKSCEFNRAIQDHTLFACINFGYYGLLQNISHFQAIPITGAKFKLSHPAIYVGSFVLFSSLLIVILTYLLCYASIQMPKKAKHSLVNMWIAISLLCFMYVFGIYQTEDVRVCQIVGMILHYFTLCSLLWMCVGVNCMYKRLSKNDIIGLQDDDLPSEEPIQKPIFGLYLVGWGIALIICGLSAAINMMEYASPSHCFLRTGPALSALYIPFAILIVFLLIFFLLIRCAIYNLDTNGHLSEGTQATEHVDLDLLEPNFPNLETRSMRSLSTKTSSSEVEDPEHAPSAQLKAYIIFLFLYVLTWLSCAFATVPPVGLVQFEEERFSIVFSYAYAVLAITLSAFTLFFYCVARNDVRTQWVLLRRWLKRKRLCFRSRNISDTTPAVPQIQIQPLPMPPISSVEVPEIQITSRSNSRSSSHTKSNSHTSNILKGAVDLNRSFSDAHAAKINNVNLVVLHRAQYRSNIIPNIIENPTNLAEVFYNPHQSTVARKFFKRQKRHMMKKNNIATRPRDLNSDTASVFSEPKAKSNTDQNIYGTNSKVNNTNIHVEQVRKIQQKNPNIFSDSAEDFDSVSNVPVENIVRTAERLRKKEASRYKFRKKHNVPKQLCQNPENNMRSVSQQCTLEYSSETISDSILDKVSPEKSLLPCEDSYLTEVSTTVAPTPTRRENSPIGSSTLTEANPNCCNIDIHSDNSPINSDYFQDGQHSTCRRKKDKSMIKPGDNYQPTEVSFSIMDSSTTCESMPRIYINPAHNLKDCGGSQSRSSSMSVSDLDELYQQIRRGPRQKHSIYANSSDLTHANSCLSDSEINMYTGGVKPLTRAVYSHENFDSFSDDVETTV